MHGSVFSGFEHNRVCYSLISTMKDRILKRFNEEIATLERELHVDLPKEIQRARELGDLRENAEYKAAKERQDIVNHSPTGIAWGYGGSGPAQCALAILIDYLGDEERARALYQDFKFKVVARFPRDSEWTLSGRQIENAISKMAHVQQGS